jgi:glycolate oxidase
VEKFHKEAYPYVYSLGGRLSGEHGIGAKKLHYMEEYTEPSELAYMRIIKRAVDPKNILNPGKIFNV